MYQNLKDELAGFTRDLNPSAGQIGIAVFINDYFNCMELFSHPDVLARLWNKLAVSEEKGTHEGLIRAGSFRGPSTSWVRKCALSAKS